MAIIKTLDGIPVRAFGVKYANKAIDLGSFRQGGARRNVVNADGTRSVERLPALASIKMLSPQGNVVWVPIANGLGKPDAEGVYGIKTVQLKKDAGFLPFAICPKRLGLHAHLAAHLAANTTPCSDASEDTPCECIREMERIRRADNVEKMEKLESARKSQIEREIASRDAHTDQLERAVMKIADAVSGETHPTKTTPVQQRASEQENDPPPAMTDVDPDAPKHGKR